MSEVMQDNRESDLLVTTGWLAAHLEERGARLIDTRRGDDYEKAHIPGAVHYPVSITPFLKENGRVLSPGRFAKLMSEMGVSDESEVIAYDDGSSLFAARLWWVLNYYGHRQVRLLTGGWDLWIAEGREVSSLAASPEPAHFTPKVDQSWIAEWEHVQGAIKNPGCAILDVRSDKEWSGADSMGTKRGGHIPSAVHLEWRETIDQADKRFKPSPVLHKIFAGVGLEPQKEVITYCQGGIRAAHAAFALRLAGYDRVRNYERSWSEWGNREDLPIESLQESGSLRARG